MIVPRPATSAGSRALVTATTPITFVSYMVRHPPRSASAPGSAPSAPPALFSSTSQRSDSRGQGRDVALAGDVADHGAAADLLSQCLEPVRAPGRAHHLVA